MKKTSVILYDNIRFLITCCQTEPSEDDITFICSYINDEHFNFNTLIALANQHAIIPLIYKTLSNINDVPTPLLAAFKKHYMHTVKENMRMTTELIGIMKLLEEHDIEALAFKGPTLAQLAYGDITLRQYVDLDILIKREKREKVVSLLLEDSYLPEITLNKQTENTFFNAVNVLGFSTSSSTFVDVHWELLSKNYAITWEEAQLWNKTASIQIHQHTIKTLCFEHSLLYLCTHGSKHLFERLSWVCDIDRIVRTQKQIDWESLLIHASNLGITRILLLSLSLSEKLLALPLPDIINDEIAKDTQVKSLVKKIMDLHFSPHRKQEKSYSTFKLLYLMRENTRDKLRFIWYALFAAKFDDFKFVQLPNYLAFLYPLVRPLRLAVKYFK